MVQRNRETGWHGQDWTSAEPLWSREHPLFKRLGASVVTVATEFASGTVRVPEVGNELRPIVAAFALHFEERFAKADKISPYVILEMVGRLYWLKGGTPEASCVYLESIGVKVAAQSRNLFISFLRFICSSHPDRSHRLGKLAQAMAYWASIVRPTPDGCDPDPEPQHEIWGTSQFTEWALDLRGYTAVAEKWREETSADASAGEPDGDFSENELPIEAERSPVHDRTAVVAANSYSESESQSSGKVVPLRQQTPPSRSKPNELEKLNVTSHDKKREHHKQYIKLLFDHYDAKQLCDLMEVALEVDNDNTQQLLDLADAVIANDFGKTAEEMHDEIQILKKQNAALQAENQRREPAAETSRGEPKKYTVPPELYQELDAELHFDKDPCPVDRPEGYNSLDEDWGEMNFVNPWFSAKRSPDGHGPTDFVRKAIEESKKGRSSFITLPVPNYVDLLLAAGAEPRSLGKVKWIEAETGEPHPHPPFIAGFLLRGKPDKE